MRFKTVTSKTMMNTFVSNVMPCSDGSSQICQSNLFPPYSGYKKL